jgi:archaellum component FlaF (FlaF/FlaG flagellin family)
MPMSITDAPQNPEQPPKSALRAILPYTTAALIIAILYVAWTFYSRYERNQKAQQALQTQEKEQRNRVLGQVYGSGEIRFITFSADSGALKRGESTQLCYGVVNAKTVKIDPPVEQAKPTYHHCLEIAPKTTTTYTIIAEDGKGNSKSQSLTIQVK